MSDEWTPSTSQATLTSRRDSTTALRRAMLEREAEMDRTWLTFKWGFLALYVLSATISQVTVAVLLNYLVAGA